LWQNDIVKEGLATVITSGELLYQAEYYRLQGELTLQKLSVVGSQLAIPNPQPLTPSTQANVEQEAEEYFRKAIDVARQQQAKSWELRAATSLARLWQQQAFAQGAKGKEQRAGTRKQQARNTQHVTRNKLNTAHKMLS
jgi:hypothetical protein